MKKNKLKYKFLVWDCCASCIIDYYNSKYWAEKRRQKEIKTRNLLQNGVVVQENWNLRAKLKKLDNFEKRSKQSNLMVG